MISNVAAHAPRPRRRALHRHHRRLQQHVEDDRRLHGHATAPTRASSARRAARTSSSPTRRPTSRRSPWRWCAAAFEYQGQKCSAASRVYVPQSIWNDVRDRVVAMIGEIKMGDVARLPQLHGRGHRQEGVRQDHRLHRARPRRTRDPRRRAGRRQQAATSSARRWSRTTDPGYKLLCEEIFGPVVTAYVYDDAKWEETLSSSTRRRPTR